MLEREIESFLVRKVREMGGAAYKFVSPGNTGVPDRIVVLPGGKIIFVELKTEKGRPSVLQGCQIKKLRKLGCDARILYGMKQVEEFLEELKGGDAS